MWLIKISNQIGHVYFIKDDAFFEHQILIFLLYEYFFVSVFMNETKYSLTLIMSHHPFHQKEWYKQGVTYLIMSHFEDLCIMWYYQKKKVENQNKLQCTKENNKHETSMFLNVKSKSKLWITTRVHHNVSSNVSNNNKNNNTTKNTCTANQLN